jgi:hypothetical protein
MQMRLAIAVRASESFDDDLGPWQSRYLLVQLALLLSDRRDHERTDDISFGSEMIDVPVDLLPG